MRQDERERLIYHAKKVLEFNWTGEYTQPGPRLYPHQWSWDSALVAIGYARYDQDRAEKELTGRGVLVRALTACGVAKVPGPTLEAAVRRNPLVATKLMTLQDARLTRHEEFLARVWTRKTLARLAGTLLYLSECFSKRDRCASGSVASECASPTRIWPRWSFAAASRWARPWAS